MTTPAGADETKAVYELVVAHLARGKEGLRLDDAGLKAVADRLAASQGEARLDGLLGVYAALEFAQSQEDGAPAATTLLGVLLAVVERTQIDGAARDQWAARLQRVTGQDTAKKVLGGPRPEGTIPAGPGARFATSTTKKK